MGVNKNVFAGFIIFAVISIYAQGPMSLMTPPPGGLHQHEFNGPMGENPPQMMLNTTELQILMNDIGINKAVSAKIIGISRNFHSFLDEHVLKIQREEINIKEELLKNKPDIQMVQTAVTKKAQIFSEIEMAQIKRDIEIKSLLTQDEYDLWKSAMIQKMRQEMQMMPDRQKPNPIDKNATQK
ncbi:MAG: hypothetical protein WBM07_12215 [Chitinivibrionales bacterium]